jgi:hypothetical protein
MSRFAPETFADFLLAPLNMLAPESWIYVEVASPDWRPLALIVLALSSVLCHLSSRRRKASSGQPASLPAAVKGTLIFVALAMPVWIFVSNNGRYALPLLALCGVACGLWIRSLYGRTRLAWVLISGLVVLQLWVTRIADPDAPWRLVSWPEARSLGLDPPIRVANSVIFTAEGVSGSVFVSSGPVSNRWIHLGHLDGSRESQRTVGLGKPKIVSSKHAFALLRIGNRAMEGLHHPEMRRAIDAKLGVFGWRLPTDSSGCSRHSSGAVPGLFLLCPLEYGGSTPDVRGEGVPATVLDAFARVEAICPRRLPSPSSPPESLDGAVWLRVYPGGDRSVFVSSTGAVWMRIRTRLHPITLATAERPWSIREGLNCSSFTLNAAWSSF